MKKQHTESLPEVEPFMEACRKEGLSVTHQRVAIYEELASTTAHPTAEQLFQVVKKKCPTVSFATVYKTLETLERLGFASKSYSTGNEARFDGNRKRHHHLICTQCDSIEDFYDDAIVSIPARLPSRFRAEEIRLEIKGICGKCR